MDYVDPICNQLACLIHGDEQGEIYLILKVDHKADDFNLSSSAPEIRWHPAADTARETPNNMFAEGEDLCHEDMHNYQLTTRPSPIMVMR